MSDTANKQPEPLPTVPPETAMTASVAKARRIVRWLQTLMSSWGGSLVVHAVLLLLLILFVPWSDQNRSAPGERMTENIGIVFARSVSTLTSQQNTAEHSQQISAADIVSQHMTELAPRKEATEIATIGTIQNAETAGNQNDSDSTPPATAVQGDGTITGSFMGAQGTGRKFVYVLDRSASTGYGNQRSPLYVAKNELLASLQSLGETGLRDSKPIQFQIIFFNNTTAVFNTVGHGGSDKSGRLIRYDQTALEKTQRFLGGIISDGGTQPEPAIMQAVRMGADCVFFMTDGNTRITPAMLERIKATAKGTQINVVEYGSGNRSRNSNLQKLAADNNGSYVFVDLSKLPR